MNNTGDGPAGCEHGYGINNDTGAGTDGPYHGDTATSWAVGIGLGLIGLLIIIGIVSLIRSEVRGDTTAAASSVAACRILAPADLHTALQHPVTGEQTSDTSPGSTTCTYQLNDGGETSIVATLFCGSDSHWADYQHNGQPLEGSAPGARFEHDDSSGAWQISVAALTAHNHLVEVSFYSQTDGASHQLSGALLSRAVSNEEKANVC